MFCDDYEILCTTPVFSFLHQLALKSCKLRISCDLDDLRFEELLLMAKYHYCLRSTSTRSDCFELLSGESNRSYFVRLNAPIGQSFLVSSCRPAFYLGQVPSFAKFEVLSCLQYRTEV